MPVTGPCPLTHAVGGAGPRDAPHARSLPAIVMTCAQLRRLKLIASLRICMSKTNKNHTDMRSFSLLDFYSRCKSTATITILIRFNRNKCQRMSLHLGKASPAVWNQPQALAVFFFVVAARNRSIGLDNRRTSM